MTYNEFVASRSWCDDLGTKLDDPFWNDKAKGVGYVYCEHLWIEQVPPFPGQNSRYWYLVIGNYERMTDDLEELQRTLYDFALNEGYALSA